MTEKEEYMINKVEDISLIIKNKNVVYLRAAETSCEHDFGILSPDKLNMSNLLANS